MNAPTRLPSDADALLDDSAVDEQGASSAETPRRPQDRRSTTSERRSGLDSRSPGEREKTGERRSGLDRRRGPGHRLTEFRRAAEDGQMNDEQLDFLKAIDEYKRVNNKPYPTLTEVLDVALYLGYRRVAPVGEFKLCKGRQTPPREPKPPRS